MNFEKSPAGGVAIGWIRNSPESARLRFHCRPRNRGKGGEVVKVYTIAYFKNQFIRNKKEFQKTPVGGRLRGWIGNSPEWARLSFHGRPRNQGKGAPQAARTDTPCKNCRQLPSTGISLAFFLYVSLTSSANWKTKNCQSEQDVDQVLYSKMGGWQCENKQHGDTVPEKARGMFLCPLQINIKKRARCGSVLWSACVLLKLELFSTQLYGIVHQVFIRLHTADTSSKN